MSSTPTPSAKPQQVAAKKAPRVTGPPKDKTSTRKRHRNYSSYSTFIYKVLKQLNVEAGVSKRAMDVMESFVNDIFERVATEAGALALRNKRQTITSREIQSALRLVLPTDLARHAISEGTVAVTRYSSSVGSKDAKPTASEGKASVKRNTTSAVSKDSKPSASSTNPKAASIAKPLPSATGEMATNGEPVPISRSKKAGICFPVGRIHTALKSGPYASRISSGAPVFLAAALEYLTAEILDIALQVAKDNVRQRIVPRHILIAVREDDELNLLLKHIDISNAGAMAYIHSFLVPRSSGKKGSTTARKTNASKAKSEVAAE